MPHLTDPHNRNHHHYIAQQRGFTLVELMVVIAIIAILSSIGIPTYQRYIQKAAITDLLQALVPYKTAVELCVLQNSLAACNAGQQGIPTSAATRYVSEINVNQGVISLTGQQSLQGLIVTLTPKDDNSGFIRWERQCNATQNESLTASCQELLTN